MSLIEGRNFAAEYIKVTGLSENYANIYNISVTVQIMVSL